MEAATIRRTSEDALLREPGVRPLLDELDAKLLLAAANRETSLIFPTDESEAIAYSLDVVTQVVTVLRLRGFEATPHLVDNIGRAKPLRIRISW